MAATVCFIQIVTAPPATDVPIPDIGDADTSHITFGVLKVAAALGDRQALLDARPQTCSAWTPTACLRTSASPV